MADGFCSDAYVSSATCWSMASLMAMMAACTEDGNQGKCFSEMFLLLE